jgi:hypothetical protein
LVVLIPVPDVVDGNDCEAQELSSISSALAVSVQVLFFDPIVCRRRQDSVKHHYRV